MNWLDLIIIIFLVGAFLRGLQTGFVQQFFSAIGFFVGIFLGAWLQGYLIGLVHSTQSKSMLALLVILSSALIFMTVGEYIGMRLKDKTEKIVWIKKIDRGLGTLLAMITILAAVWVGAAIFNKVPVYGLQQQISGSRIVAALNNTLPSAPGVIAKIGHFINPNGFPQVFTGLEPKLQTDAPLPELGDLRPAVEKARPSVVKIAGEGCGGIVEGSGFVAAENMVVTNAHVVAGVRNPHVVDTSGDHKATVVWFDPNLDIAILRTSNLVGDALTLNGNRMAAGTQGVVLGYPSGQGFTASPAVILESFTATGRNIYNQGNTERSVHSVKSDIRQGNSGGPLIGDDGSVIGLVFAKSTTYPNVGYTLTMDQVIDAVHGAQNRTSAVATGACAQ